MILAIDTFYLSEKAKTVGVLFKDWTDLEPEEIITSWTDQFGPYIPGKFYLRELPPIMSLLGNIQGKEEKITHIVVDGFLRIHDKEIGKLREGLGDMLLKRLKPWNPLLIGVAKKDFGGTGSLYGEALEYIRGPKGSTPLWIQGGGGLSNEGALQLIRKMKGQYRLPELLRILDKETKKEG